MLLEAFPVWNSVLLSFQCEINGEYQNSSECRGYSDRAKMMSKLISLVPWPLVAWVRSGPRRTNGGLGINKHRSKSCYFLLQAS